MGNVKTLIDPSYIRELKKKKLESKFMKIFDLNNNEEITWGEYHLAFVVKKTNHPQARDIFKFFDRNHDWKITKKELNKAKPQDLEEWLG